MTQIAPTAVVDKSAQLGDAVRVGPGCVIGPDVVIGDDCELVANVLVCRGVRIGPGNVLGAGCVLGEAPQIKGVPRNAPGQLIVGQGNTFREYVTIHRGSPHGSGKTIIGDHNYLMAYCHLGHDVEMQDNVLMANVTNIAGHCRIESNAWLCAFCGTHQFVTVGRFTYAAGSAAMAHDAPPYMKVAGDSPATVRAVNLTGLARAGLSEQSLQALRCAYRALYRRRNGQTLAGAVAQLDAQPNLDEHVRYLLDFLKRSAQDRFGRYRELARK